VTDLEEWREFARRERARGISLAILIGGEPSLFPGRLSVFVEEMPYVWLSTNGVKQIPVEGFEKVAVSVTLFGGGALDDELRGILPGGRRTSGLFETALKNYHNDKRVFFVYALSPDSSPHVEDVVRRIGDNGNQVLFNYYSPYDNPDSPDTKAIQEKEKRLLERVLEVREAYPQVVLSHPYYIRTLITGSSHWGKFGYDVCPSISRDYEGNRERIANGNPTLPGFNAIAPDLKTVNMCCTSGHCGQCRDSQAVISWLMMSLPHFLESRERLMEWVEIGESFWRQFCWSPYHPTANTLAASGPQAVVPRVA
jgi:hypothetical protein